jgi:hypothetical protein
VELQWEYFRLGKKYAQDNETDEVTDDVLDRWEAILEGLETDPLTRAKDLDWVAKLSLMEAYRDRDGLEWADAKLKMIDLQYHDVRRSKGLYHKLLGSGKIARLVSPKEVEHAIDNPPVDTRAYFRGESLRRFSDSVVAASWDALIFDTGAEPLRKVPTMEPTKGTREHVQDLFDASPDASALLANLSS